MVRPPSVTAEAEVRSLDRAEAQTMLVVVTGRAQPSTQIASGLVTDEVPSRHESLAAQRRPCGAITVQRLLDAAREVLARDRLLELGLVTAATLRVLNGLREVRMVRGRVALSAADALGAVEARGVLGSRSSRVARLAPFDVHGRSGDGPGGPLPSPLRDEAATEQDREDQQRERRPPSDCLGCQRRTVTGWRARCRQRFSRPALA